MVNFMVCIFYHNEKKKADLVWLQSKQRRAWSTPLHSCHDPPSPLLRIVLHTARCPLNSPNPSAAPLLTENVLFRNLTATSLGEVWDLHQCDREILISADQWISNVFFSGPLYTLKHYWGHYWEVLFMWVILIFIKIYHIKN